MPVGGEVFSLLVEGGLGFLTMTSRHVNVVKLFALCLFSLFFPSQALKLWLMTSSASHVIDSMNS